jgi:hypothetical protein
MGDGSIAYHSASCGIRGKPMENWTLKQFAEHYAETMAKPANGWGLHVSDIFGQSHHIMIAATTVFGRDAVQEAFAEAIQKNGE